jgi:hypothetical protein
MLNGEFHYIKGVIHFSVDICHCGIGGSKVIQENGVVEEYVQSVLRLKRGEDILNSRPRLY